MGKQEKPEGREEAAPFPPLGGIGPLGVSFSALTVVYFFEGIGGDGSDIYVEGVQNEQNQRGYHHQRRKNKEINPF
jgi:hypothetical protein